MRVIFCDCCRKKVEDISYPVSFWAIRFDFCKECYTQNLDNLVRNRMLMQMDPTHNPKKNQGKEILN